MRRKKSFSTNANDTMMIDVTIAHLTKKVPRRQPRYMLPVQFRVVLNPACSFSVVVCLEKQDSHKFQQQQVDRIINHKLGIKTRDSRCD